jgi:V-type H+-transporting ATPase subunit H
VSLLYTASPLGFPLTDDCSTFDEYASEVESGHLSWTPTHESEDFWKENVEKIRFENKGKVVK